MREGEHLYCIKKCTEWYNKYDCDGVLVGSNIGDKWVVDEVFTNTVYIKNSKGNYMFFYMDRLIEYFETVEERRCRLIGDLV